MPRRGYSNTAYPIYLIGSLDGSSSTNTITVSTAPDGVATSPPGWPATRPYFAVIDPDTPSEEIVSVTAVTGGTLTITRGTALGASGYGTTTKAHNSGAKILHVTTAADVDEANLHVNSSTQVHGLASGSAVVGTTDTQTLTNKTLSTGTVQTAVAHGGGGTVVGSTATQTLTNKTLTSPTVTNGTFATPTITNPVVTGGTWGGEAVVTPTSTHTLTNKTLSSAVITGAPVTGSMGLNAALPQPVAVAGAVTFPTNWVLGSEGQLIRKIDLGLAGLSLVVGQINFGYTGATTITSTTGDVPDTLMFTIPAGYRPTQNCNVPVQVLTRGPGMAFINASTGAVTLQEVSAGNITTNIYMRMTFTYLTT